MAIPMPQQVRVFAPFMVPVSSSVTVLVPVTVWVTVVVSPEVLVPVVVAAQETETSSAYHISSWVSARKNGEKWRNMWPKSSSIPFIILPGRVRDIDWGQNDPACINNMLCGYPSFPIWTLPVLNFQIQREKLKLPTPSKEKHAWPSHFEENECLFTNIMSFVLSKPLIFYNRKSTSHARLHSTPSKTTKTHSRKINQHYYRVLFRLSWLNSHFDLQIGRTYKYRNPYLAQHQWTHLPHTRLESLRCLSCHNLVPSKCRSG